MAFRIGFEPEDQKVVQTMWEDIFATQQWSEGKYTELFETLWGQMHNLESVAFSSWATAAAAACAFYDLRGKTVLCPSNTFMATPLAAVHAGARVEFVDCNRSDLCMSYEDLVRKMDLYRPAAVFLVHVGGHIAFEVNEIARLCRERGAVLIEDCAHAHGAEWNGQRAGSWGDLGVYSFYATKTISTGEGGVLVSRNKDLLAFARAYRNYGKPDYAVAGTNGRMSEFTAALGCVQTKRLPDIVRWKQTYAKEHLDPQFPNRVRFPQGMQSGYYKYIVFQPTEPSTGKVYDAPCHTIMKKPYALPNTEWVAQNHWCVPLYYKGDASVQTPVVVSHSKDEAFAAYKKVLITGGSGFIGSHVVERLTARGIKVRIYDLISPEYLDDIPAQQRALIDHYQGSLLDEDQLRLASTGVDAIYHLAAVANVNDVAADPAYAHRINTHGTFTVLETARKQPRIKRVIFASTVWVYQNTPQGNGPLDEDAPLSHPDHFYTASKIAGEAMCRSYAKMYDTPVTILRFGIPYGTRARGQIVTAAFVDKALRGEPITIQGDGSQYRKFLYVQDLAEGCVLALKDVALGKIYNLEGDEKVSVKQVAETVRALLGNVDIQYTDGRQGDFSGKEISNQRAKQELGWAPSISFQDGMKRYVDWYRTFLMK